MKNKLKITFIILSLFIIVLLINSFENTIVTQTYAADTGSPTPLLSDVIVINNVDKPSTITLNNLNPGDKIMAYSDIGLSVASQLGSETKVALGKTSATISVPDKKLTPQGGNLYLTLKQVGFLYSSPLTVPYTAAPQASVPVGVTIVNNVDSNKKSTITVGGLTPGDKFIAYKNTNYNIKEVWGISTVGSKATSVVINIGNNSSLPESGLGSASGSVYVSVRTKYFRDSTPLSVAYLQKPKNSTPNVSDITIDNFNTYDNVKDVVTLINLTPGDIVRVWNDPVSSLSTALIAKDTVLTGKTTLSFNTIKATSLNSAGGNVYISVKSINSLESDRQIVGYSAEP